MRVIHYHKEYPTHDWVKNEKGEIDDFAFEFGDHSGPVCRRCGYSFCIFCKGDEGYNAEPCVEDWYVCPKCRKRFYIEEGVNFCPMCGQELEWEEEEQP
jgi:uncharacterized protein YbaR (Trm112 family)